MKQEDKDMKVIVKKLKSNYVNDLRKVEIDPKERAILIKEMMEAENLSQRGFAKKYGFSHNTIQDWLLWNRVTEDQITSLKEDGLTRTDIYRHLRNHKQLEGDEITALANASKFDIDIDEFTRKCREHTTTLERTHNTVYKLQELRNIISRLVFKLTQVHRNPKTKK